MSTLVNGGEQSTSEIRTHYFDFTKDLPVGVTVVSLAATHIPPKDGTVKTVATTLSSPTGTATLPNPVEIGRHYIKVVGTLSNGETSEIRISINVRF